MCDGVVQAELERLDRDNQRLMDLQKLSSLLRVRRNRLHLPDELHLYLLIFVNDALSDTLPLF